MPAKNFEALAMEVFWYQTQKNPLYGRYLQLLNRPAEKINTLADIPFLPISFFKTHRIRSGRWQPERIFLSSTTTQQQASQHQVRQHEHYLANARKGFAQFYGAPENWCFLALLPNYLERGASSLVAMFEDFIARSKFRQSGFFLNDIEKLRETLLNCQQRNIKTMLLGVSFALLDFAEKFPMSLKGITVMETGGMKGRRREITRNELHETLKQVFLIDNVHSEYGMTELFSQGYATGGTIFQPAPTLMAFAREVNDPFCWVENGKTGVLNFIDLANLDTCSFIATEDIGRVFDDGSFEVLGRLDTAEMRGCNLMVE